MMGPYAEVDYILTLCPLQSRLQHIYYGQPIPESTLTLCQSRLYAPVRDLRFGLCWVHCLSGVGGRGGGLGG
jgi:hypothetical protein